MEKLATGDRMNMTPIRKPEVLFCCGNALIRVSDGLSVRRSIALNVKREWVWTMHRATHLESYIETNV